VPGNGLDMSAKIHIRTFVVLMAANLLASPLPADPNSGPVVSVTGGAIMGRILPGEGGAVFRGVPFAQPPVGGLRWREPMPVVPWEGVRQAAKPGPPAEQAAIGWNEREAAASSEDCLYLDVWTPHEAPGRLPVMVWIHGGANVAGSGGFDPLYDGRSMISHGVVLVVIEYRLGIFGFFAHPGLTRESPHHASGNYAILDQIAALQWVHDNIAKFGGDPGSVTLFGQSAGGTDVLALMASPLSGGLFHRAISESSQLQNRNVSLAEAEQAGSAMAEGLGGPSANDIAHLRSLSSKEIMKAWRGYSAFTTDGWVFPTPPFEAWRTGRERAVPLIIGSNAVEFPFGGSPGDLVNSIRAAFGDLAPRALSLYGLDGGKEAAAADPLYGYAADQWGSDLFRCPAVVLGGWHSAANPTWEYEFARAIPPQPRVAHSGELPYVFGNLLSTGSKAGNYQEADRRLSGVIQAYWTSFARTGDPNAQGLPPWGRYDAAGKGYLAFTADSEVAARENERGPFCDLFRESLGTPPPSR
jgi:para-nitrobenzyl esterase